ncbi:MULTISPECIES: DUF3892 domain-containing protein [Sphingomonadaceae]|jgi:hypothetical protein|uniref:DUF3892 domain-containing protein n=3 Tax=Sphingomonadaceae TaxID=41297 RepID=A0A0S3F637_9SPHN|nr:MULTISPECIES: DUF3892 domain-containing protein [Sphingomonadaceae]ALR23131.1 hypothetical protein ATN00_21745 [Sphingobium baderi]ETI59605.1 hypothetical protein C100_20620 [Sphingobium sp. C100]MBB4050217.1 hypothetical protein [Sphingomonas zeae]NUU45520.1 DUF3892 domain-containing protein [Sphingomonas zeae]PNU02799.1 hypothetical protein A8V01_25290 [Novosphingobium guangzhouense]
MAKRYVNKTGKDRDGDITKLCNAGQSWSPRFKADAIRDIENGDHQYYVSWTDGQETPITVVNGPSGKYLRTRRDGSTKNNLDDLLDC